MDRAYREPVTTQEQSRRSAGFRLGVGGVVVVVLVALAVTIVIGMLRTARPEAVAVESSPASSDAVTAPAVFVHVSGAVAEPGLYHLAAGARVFDAVSAAGGFADDADSGAVNLARLIGDGEQLHVPTVAEAGETAERGGAESVTGGKVNLNTADLAALDTLPRVGPAIAQRIIDWREANGRFTSIEDLLSVPGIGEKMLAGIRDLVTV